MLPSEPFIDRGKDSPRGKVAEASRSSWLHSNPTEPCVSLNRGRGEWEPFPETLFNERKVYIKDSKIVVF